MPGIILAQMRNPSHETGVEQNKKQAVDCVGSMLGWRIDDVALNAAAAIWCTCVCLSVIVPARTESMEIMSCALSNRAIYTYRATPSFVYGFRIAVIYSEPVFSVSDCFAERTSTNRLIENITLLVIVGRRGRLCVLLGRKF